MGKRFQPQILESFDPATQELYWHLLATIHTEIHTKIETLEEGLGSQNTDSSLQGAGPWAKWS
jgi:hypothetical protein